MTDTFIEVTHVGCRAGGVAKLVQRGSRVHDYLSNPARGFKIAMRCEACGDVMDDGNIKVLELFQKPEAPGNG